MTTTTKIMRADYLNGLATHQDYYAQFVTPEIRDAVARHIGVERIRKSRDPHLNDIPLGQWDALSQYVNIGALRTALREHGDGYSNAGLVCVTKLAARQLTSENSATV